MNKYKIEENDKTLKYCFPSNLSVLNPIIDETILFLGDLDLDLFGLKLILLEGLTNAIKHGNKLDENKSVSFEIYKNGKTLTLIISDEGEGFDWSELIKKEMQDITETGGRGIILMKAYDYIPVYNEKGNILTLTKTINIQDLSTQKLKREKIAKQILIVEDDPFSRKIIARLMEKYGIVNNAKNGQEAVELVEQSIKENNLYDLICLDIMMPIKNGLDALKEIREMEISADVAKSKIVMTTALDDRENIIEALENGANSYLTKPIKRDSLDNKLKEIELIT